MIYDSVAYLNSQGREVLYDAEHFFSGYEDNPEYLSLLLAQANASALNETDKVIFTPEGTVPTLVLPGPGIVPTVDTTPNTNAVETSP